MTQKEKLEALEKRVEMLEHLVQQLTLEQPTEAKSRTSKVITSYSPKIVKSFVETDEMVHTRGGR